ncbi:uncharacterized protein CIMG_07577 [Coccidioides immitis RS]|uniref:Methyltransferase domain-containing protein n=1 Tax=Coccidioides immitis (strain RS) TaxID=246410 RepID=J3K3P3_COCIM|nr:uncharacterized protein CIMG_07577 [Coccidioides immitis RS]EAS28831.3 hypothetical protein CIMG_07577 [Coccidioides immitis RS]
MVALTQLSGAETDHWSAEAYHTSASFVPLLTQKVLAYIDPHSTDQVLDIGCGDGKFTAKYMDRVSHVLGLDASKGMIEAAKSDFGQANAEFRVVDCRYLDKELQEGRVGVARWDKVVSNAALHWILKDPTTRVSVLRAIYTCLKPGGLFVFEMGGHGNVPEVHSALIAALVHHGVSFSAAREGIPWFFASEPWMRETLEEIGFRVDKLEVEYRPTKLTTDEKGGMQGWLRLMGASALEMLDEEKRERVVKEVCETLESVITREDGSQWLGYVRLRGVAVKSEQ